MEEIHKAKVIGGVGVGMISTTLMIFILTKLFSGWGNKALIIPVVIGLLLIGVAKAKSKKVEDAT